MTGVLCTVYSAQVYLITLSVYLDILVMQKLKQFSTQKLHTQMEDHEMKTFIEFGIERSKVKVKGTYSVHASL